MTYWKCYIFYDRGGRRGWTVKWARNWRIWKWYADYFPIKIVSDFSMIYVGFQWFFVAQVHTRYGPHYKWTMQRISKWDLLVDWWWHLSQGYFISIWTAYLWMIKLLLLDATSFPHSLQGQLNASIFALSGEDSGAWPIAQLLAWFTPPRCPLLRGSFCICHWGYFLNNNPKDHFRLPS